MDQDDYIQLDMYNNTEIDFIKAEIKLALQKGTLAINRSDNIRRGLFARHNELEKRIQTLEETNDNLIKNLEILQSDLDQLRSEIYGKNNILKLQKTA